MDMESGKEQIIRSVKKYQYVLWAVLLGVFLMLLPQKKEEPEREIPAQTEAALTLEEELSAMLSKISGVGKAEVLLTEVSGSSTIYQTDTTQNQGNSDTVIVMDRNRGEQGLVKQVVPPG